ncbi:MAG: NUDIX domain-containing protein [Clostridia bacterium]|nr:NUDIX domain-containing protein [Clostridia bacterium]
MLGKIVKVRITAPMNSVNRRFGYTYGLNFGFIESGSSVGNSVQGAYIMGVSHPVRHFEGRVIATIKRLSGKGIVCVVAPKSTKYIITDIKKAVSFSERVDKCAIECLYERSCGAVIYHDSQDGKRRFLLIKNKRSCHWGFPKGHIEDGENYEQTALREVKEETGLDIRLINGFSSKSNYTIQGKIDKTVIIFLGKSDTDAVTLQQEEIDDSRWVEFDDAMSLLNFENDKNIFKKAGDFLACAERS